MSLWIPPTISHELHEETRKREAQALQHLQSDQQWAWKKEFDAELDRICPGMKLVWCPDPAPIDAVVMGARAGRWGLLCPPVNGGPWTVKPLLAPDGEGYAEPGAWVYDMLREQDWWHPQVRRERERAKEELERAKRKREAREDEERDQEVLERYLAGTRAWVSMDRSNPWSQSVRGRRGARR